MVKNGRDQHYPSTARDIAQRLGARWKDLSRAALESLGLEAYRSELLTAYELRRLLGIESRFELDGFLKEHGVYLEYTPEELEREAGNSRRLMIARIVGAPDPRDRVLGHAQCPQLVSTGTCG
jgi:hypothetical protein